MAHLYNLRRSRTLRQRRISYPPTQPPPGSIAERRAPQPEGRPGQRRVDRVPAGDAQGNQGVDPIPAVDEVTQGRVVGVTQIWQAWLIPVREARLE